MNILIKASRIAHLTDARYFAAKEVDFLGFNLEEGTQGYLDPMYMKAIREWVEGPKIVGEFSRTPAPVIREAAAFFGLDAVQVPVKVYQQDLDALQGLDLILEFDARDQDLLAPAVFKTLAARASVILFNFFDTNISKSALYEDIDAWRERCAIRPCLLQADIPAAAWPELLAALGFAGLSVEGGEEEQVGVKSYDEIDTIFEALGRV